MKRSNTTATLESVNGARRSVLAGPVLLRGTLLLTIIIMKDPPHPIVPLHIITALLLIIVIIMENMQ